MTEVLYKSSPEDSQLVSNPPVMCDRVQALANNIYREFEILISSHGDAVIKNLMPQVVSILESLNVAYREKQEQEVEAELMREEANNLRIQFDKEKLFRRMTEQKYLQMEDTLEEERKQNMLRVEELECNVRRLEVKIRNMQDHLSRQDERKAELKEENERLHARYNEIMKSHAEYVERSKLVADRSGDWSSPARSIVSGLSLKHSTDLDERMESYRVESNVVPSVIRSAALSHQEDISLDESSYMNYSSSPVNKSHERIKETTNAAVDIAEPKETTTTTNDNNNKVNAATTSSSHTDWLVSPESSFDRMQNSMGNDVSLISGGTFDEEFDHSTSSAIPTNNLGYERLNGLQKNTSSIFAELSGQDSEALNEIDVGADLSVMSAEIEKIIQENNDLLTTKNALNIVKDDLIAQLDELTGEQELLKEELRHMSQARDRLDGRVYELEEELKNCREELEEARSNLSSENRFSRADMARVIMDRNNYKEKLMELQEAVRYAEILRASREHPDLIEEYSSTSPTATSANRRKGPLWSLFNNLSGGGTSKSTSSSSVDPLAAQTDSEEKKKSTSKSNKPTTSDASSNSVAIPSASYTANGV